MGKSEDEAKVTEVDANVSGLVVRSHTTKKVTLLSLLHFRLLQKKAESAETGRRVNFFFFLMSKLKSDNWSAQWWPAASGSAKVGGTGKLDQGIIIV